MALSCPYKSFRLVSTLSASNIEVSQVLIRLHPTFKSSGIDDRYAYIRWLLLRYGCGSSGSELMALSATLQMKLCRQITGIMRMRGTA